MVLIGVFQKIQAAAHGATGVGILRDPAYAAGVQDTLAGSAVWQELQRVADSGWQKGAAERVRRRPWAASAPSIRSTHCQLLDMVEPVPSPFLAILPTTFNDTRFPAK
jgi:hypothetical protein